MKGNLLFLTFLTTALMLTSCQKSALEELESTIARQQIVIPCPQAGLWYIAVRCLTTVTSTDAPLGQEYTGRTDVLNGVPYSIKASWTVIQDAAIDIYY